MEYRVNTEKLKTIQTTLTQERQKLLKKSSVFYGGAFSSSGSLSNALYKTKNVYSNIAQTLENIGKYLKEYTDDVENYENAMSGNGGNVTASDASSMIRMNDSLRKNKLFSYEMDSTPLFQIRTYQPKSSGNQAKSSVSATTTDDYSSDEGDVADMLLNAGFPDLNFDLSTFDLNLSSLDFNLDGISTLNLDLSSLGSLSMASLGTLGTLNLGTLDIGAVGNFQFSDLDLSSRLILGDLLQIQGIDISGLGDFGTLTLADIEGLDISKLTINASTLNMLQNEIQLGNISEIDALKALHQLFPNLSGMSFSEIMALASVNGVDSLSSLSPLSMGNLSTGAISGVGVASGLMLGLGIFGGLGGHKSSANFGQSFSAPSGNSAASRGNSFSFLGDALRDGEENNENIAMDQEVVSQDDIYKEEKNVSTLEDIVNPMYAFLHVDYDTLLEDAFSRLKRFNRTKKMCHYFELIEQANSVRWFKNRKDFAERIICLIPDCLSGLMKKYSVFDELMHQNVVFPDVENYESMYQIIGDSTLEYFRWLPMREMFHFPSMTFQSELQGQVELDDSESFVTKNFRSAFWFLREGITDIARTYQKIYEDEVPQVFHSDRVIDVSSSDYDILLEKLESLSVQATFNDLSVTDARTRLVSMFQDIHQSNLYCFQDMVRSKQGRLETLLVVRIGDGVQAYRYYAMYPGVGMKEIYSLDVQMLMKAGFQLKEE